MRGNPIPRRSLAVAGAVIILLALSALALFTLRGHRDAPAEDGADAQAFTLLHRAAEKGLVNSLRAQLAKGQDVNVKDRHDMTPLHYAAREGRREAAVLLLDAGALVGARGQRGWTPLHMAAAMGQTEIAELLLDRGADPSVADDAGLTPLHHAAAEGKAEVTRVLLSRDAAPNAADMLGWTPLHHASYTGNEEICDLLLAGGADADARNTDGSTALDVARLRATGSMLGPNRRRASALDHTREQAPAAPDSRPNVLLIVVDALRPDRLGCYGYARNTSPNLDALAAEGVLFTDAMSHGPATVMATPALLTGRRPGEHGMEWVRWDEVRRYAKPGEDGRTLAELLREHGYHTAAISANPVLGEEIGLHRGFDSYDLSCAQEDVWRAMSAAAVNQRAYEWLRRDGHAQAPFFLYLHYMEPHNLYCPPSEFCVFGRPGYTPADTQLNTEMNLLADSAPDHRVTEGVLSAQGFSLRDVERLSDLYDAEVLCSDHYLNELFRQLRDLGVYENTLIVVTADHGEAFLEHDTLEHSETLYQELLRVPLIMRGPGIAAGREIAHLVELVDVAPTILEAAGLPVTTPMSGTSLYKVISDREAITDDVGLAFLPPKEMYALRLGSLKFIVSPERTELYDLATDPHEQTDLALSRPEDVTRLRKTLESQLHRHPAAVERRETPTADQLKALKSLGYLK